jgi:hypothetical protein
MEGVIIVDTGKLIVEIAGWTIVAALVVLIVMNASNFAKAISGPLTFWSNETSMFTGSGYNTPGYGRQFKAA